MHWDVLYRHAASGAGGFLAAVMFMSSQHVDIYGAVQHIQNGVRELTAAGAILVPLALGIWGAFKKGKDMTRAAETGDPNPPPAKPV